MVPIPACTVQQRCEGSGYQISQPGDGAGLTGHSQNTHKFTLHIHSNYYMVHSEIYYNNQFSDVFVKTQTRQNSLWGYFWFPQCYKQLNIWRNEQDLVNSHRKYGNN